ncbi:glutaredoxin 3 [Rhodotorula toruloides]|uniref:Glutaredoxin 3 n=1 Tax=Rhodotorula toruloides TaxID=5286 RepID=A0A511K7M9_RHOTO|nr:glutaredoxin 3 [Rhodotorula toruloides]
MSSIFGAVRNYARSFFSTPAISQEQVALAKETVEVLELNHEQNGSAIQQYLAERVGAARVTVYIKGKPVGGCSDLKKLQAEGKLSSLLA